MNIEEYILMRKKEDGLNEYDRTKRSENLRICVNYVFEYFNNYLEENPDLEKTILQDKKLEKYRNQIQQHSLEVQSWLIEMYSSTGKYMNRQLRNLIDDPYFLLFSTDAEFRAISYEVYPKAIKKFPVLEGQGEMIYEFIKDVHRIDSSRTVWDQKAHITEAVDAWIDDTYKKHGVNIYAFCEKWCYYYSQNVQLWPKGYKIRDHAADSLLEYKGLDLSSSWFWDYDYKKGGDVFGLSNLYRKMPKKEFTRGKKQYFEATMMHWWTHHYTVDQEFWDQYVYQLEQME